MPTSTAKIAAPPAVPTASAWPVAVPDRDVRTLRDAAVRRGWAEIVRRAGRICVLVAGDVGSALALLAAAGWVLGRVAPAYAAEAAALGAAAVLIQPLALKAFGGYDTGRRRARMRTTLGAATATSAIAWVLHGPSLPAPAHAALHLGYALCAGVGLYAGRLLINWLVDRVYGRGMGQRRMIVVGSEAEARRVEEVVGAGARSHVRVVGRVALHPAAVGDGAWNDLEEALHACRASGVLLASELPFETLETVVHRCLELGATVALVPQLLHKLDTRVELRETGAGALLQLHTRGLGVPQLAVKRALDLVLCVAGLLLVWPLFALIAIAIKLDSRGPVLFRQVRAGVGGRPFDMYKFRTMVHDADRLKVHLAHLNESGDPRLFKIRMDPRVTRVGRLLRRTSLDELPQLLNVIRGDMSLVGPRPFFPGDLDGYEEHHFERLLVLPGITGLWQVSGRSDVVDFEEVVRLDAKYIREWTVKLDLMILARTLPAAFGRGGAY
jgi:exopolysaccharide biosynthesis polyprenyl glycosylphosphotransferase